MARNTLPAIEVKEELATRRLKLPKQLDSDIASFAQFYGGQTGGRVPEESAVIIGVLRDFFNGNVGFQAFLKDRQKEQRKGDARASGGAAQIKSAPSAPVPPAKA